LVQARIDCLLTMQARERHDKLKKAEAKIERLTAENERLKQELAAARPQDAVAAALLNASKKSDGGTR
jgi:hypothetical protein